MLEITMDEKFSKAVDETVKSSEKDFVKVLHQAAYEVEIPARDSAHALFNHPTGNLPSSIHSTIDATALEARVGTNLEYARLREFGGTVDNAWGRVTAHHVGRPYLIPAFQKAIPKIRKLFQDFGNKITKDLAQRSK